MKKESKKILYLDCGMGAAGDMLAAALYELLDDIDRQHFMDTMDALAPESVSVTMRPETKCGILGTHFDVLINGEEEASHDYSGEDHDHEHAHAHAHTHAHSHDHAHHSMADVEAIIRGFAGISGEVRESILEVYGVIAEAESSVHGTEVSEVHFHEVGMMDAIIDVTAVCVLMDMLGADSIIASPVRTGKGYVKCAHGILPVPAPATALLLTGIPTYAGDLDGEMCTPTGAALLRHFVSEFAEQPVMTTERIGYGMGTKSFAICNCVRAMLGTA